MSSCRPRVNARRKGRMLSLGRPRRDEEFDHLSFVPAMPPDGSIARPGN